MALPPLMLTAFLDELEKIAVQSKEDRKKRQHAYYVAKRQQILQKNRGYKMQNRDRLLRKNRAYNKKVKLGIKHPRRRMSTGNFSTTYVGFR